MEEENQEFATAQIEQVKLFRIHDQKDLDKTSNEANEFAIKVWAEHGNSPRIHHSAGYVSVIYSKLCKYKKVKKLTGEDLLK